MEDSPGDVVDGYDVAVPAAVRRAVDALVPGTELEESHEPMSRDPGGLSFGWAASSVGGVWHRVGFKPPRLSSLLGGEVVEHLAVPGLGGVPDRAVGADVEPDPVALIAYLPVDVRWERAAWDDVPARGATLMWLQPHREGTWPAPSLPRQRVAVDYRGDDFALVEVQGVVVGVQVGRLGTCQLSWVVRRGAVGVEVSVWTRRTPLVALEMVLVDGVLV